ncbi:alpha/beta hydrolase [Streptomyces sp. NPDC020802]|uniref:alpha/beta hydrolase n=1 Tax=Streptomyces sp. NPDC020802 TaxID=3365094 RepID=UPI0037B760AC
MFHPDLRRAASWLPRSSVSPRTLKAVRTLSGLAARRASEDVEVHLVRSVPVRLHRPPTGEELRPALLWIHGGGFVFGTAAQDDDLCRRFARELGITVAAVDYRLAPEHPFPTPLHDCYDAFGWLAARADVDSTRVAIGGASAGGGLAAALALLTRERGETRPVFQSLSYPMLDDRTAARDDIDGTDHRMWNNKANGFGWRSYTGCPPGSTEVGELAAPARHDDLSGLPPAWIGVGTVDLFHEEDLAYADRLEAAGVERELVVSTEPSTGSTSPARGPESRGRSRPRG